MPYFAHSFKDILRQCDQHGVEHRLPMNQTPLMAAAAAGNVPLIEALLALGADREVVNASCANRRAQVGHAGGQAARDRADQAEIEARKRGDSV